jgi:hypothetical protein
MRRLPIIMKASDASTREMMPMRDWGMVFSFAEVDARGHA